MTFKSCNNILFKVHRNNIMTYSEGFAPPDGTLLPEGEIVPLPESTNMLELLFQYIYPQCTLDLKDLFKCTCQACRDSREISGVFSHGHMPYLHGVCQIPHKSSGNYSLLFVRDIIPHHPLQVLDYAMRHHLLDLADKVEEKYLLTTPEEAIKCLNLPTYVVWVSQIWTLALLYADS